MKGVMRYYLVKNNIMWYRHFKNPHAVLHLSLNLHTLLRIESLLSKHEQVEVSLSKDRFWYLNGGVPSQGYAQQICVYIKTSYHTTL